MGFDDGGGDEDEDDDTAALPLWLGGRYEKG